MLTAGSTEAKKTEHHGSINSRIPTSFIKYALILPSEPVQEHHTINRPLSDGILMTENSKGYNPLTYIKLYVKDKDVSKG